MANDFLSWIFSAGRCKHEENTICPEARGDHDPHQPFEPSEGIAPIIVAGMRNAVLAMRERGVAVLVSEQNLAFVASMADRAVLIEQGRVTGGATRQDLMPPSAAVQRVLGV